MNRKDFSREDAILRELYGKSSVAEIQRVLPHCTINWIRQRAFKLGISRKIQVGSAIQIGDIFGELTVLSRSSVRCSNGAIKIRLGCKCSCGSTLEVDASHLKRGTRSCGCQTSRLIAESKRLKAGHSTTTQLIRGYQAGAKDRNLVWAISRSQFEDFISGNCYYCGAPPSNKRELLSGDSLYWNGIDRRNNDKGYVIGNCVTCCKICNLSKHTLTEDEFRAWVCRISKSEWFCHE